MTGHIGFAFEQNDAARALLGIAAELAPRWGRRSARAESLGALPPDTVEELFEAGLLSIATAHRYGGAELGWPALLETSRCAARACASTGWMIALMGGHAALACRLPEVMQQRMFGNGRRQLISTATPSETGILTSEAGDYRISGLWRYCTGVDHATWILARCYHAGDLIGVTRPGHLVLLDPRQVTVRHDAWQVMGMRGTGSKDFTIHDQFVQPEMTLRLSVVLDARPDAGSAGRGGYLAEVPFQPYFLSLLIGAIVGCAEGAYDEYLEGTRSRRGGGTGGLLAERLAESSGKIVCAGHLYRSILETLHRAGLSRRELTPYEQARVGRDRAYLARLCVEAVHGLVRQLGTRAMSENDPVCRHWRDLQVMASHLDVSWDRWMLAYGDHVLSAVPSHGVRAPS